jgi:hypothetical protein
MRRIIPIMVLVSLLLSACQAAAPQATLQPSGTLRPTAVVPAATATTAKPSTNTPESKSTSSSLELASGSSPGCTVQSPFPTPGPTEQALLPPIGINDWVVGSESAQITFTEYSDFQ